MPHNIEEINALPDEAAKKFFDHFSKNKASFIERYTMNQKQAFNKRFENVEEVKKSLPIRFSPLTLEKIQDLKNRCSISSFHIYFVNNPEEWNELGKDCQEAFNVVFTKERYKAFEVTHKD